MRSRARLKIKITMASLGSIVLLQPSIGISAGAECVDVVKNLNLSEIAQPDSQSINQKIQNLSELKLSLDLAKVNGTSDISITTMKANYEAKENELVAYLEKNKIMTKAQLIEKIRQQIAVLQGQNSIDQESRNKARDEASRRKKEQEREIKESVIDGKRAISHRIEPGPFMMGEVGQQKSVTLTKAFDMMATPTTQFIYKAIADLANAKLPTKYKIEDVDPSHFKGGLHPVEQVSYEDVQVWLGALNELSQRGETTLQNLIPGHKQGDVYRLPTEAEWEFVVRGRGTLNETYHFGDTEADLKDHAWYRANSGSVTHPVAQKKPLIIDDGKEFYDMHGNVWEWVHDWYGEKLTGGVDPQGPEAGRYRVLRGGSRSNKERFLRSANRIFESPGDRFTSVGFRIVRTVK